MYGVGPWQIECQSAQIMACGHHIQFYQIEKGDQKAEGSYKAQRSLYDLAGSLGAGFMFCIGTSPGRVLEVLLWRWGSKVGEQRRRADHPSTEVMSTTRKQLDPRLRILIENNVKKNHRSFIVLVGDRGRDRVCQNFSSEQPRPSLI